MITDSPGSPSESQGSLKVKKGGKEEGQKEMWRIAEEMQFWRWRLLVLKMEEEGHKARMWAASSTGKGNGFSPRASGKEPALSTPSF